MGTGFIPPHVECDDPAVVGNVMVCLCAQTGYLLDQSPRSIALRLAAQPTKGYAVKPENYTDLPEELVQQTAPCFREREEAARGL